MAAQQNGSRWATVIVGVLSIAVTSALVVGGCALAHGRERDQQIAKLQVQVEPIEPLRKSVDVLGRQIERLSTHIETLLKSD